MRSCSKLQKLQRFLKVVQKTTSCSNFAEQLALRSVSFSLEYAKEHRIAHCSKTSYSGLYYQPKSMALFHSWLHLIANEVFYAYAEAYFTCSTERVRNFQNNSILWILDGFLSKTTGVLPKCTRSLEVNFPSNHAIISYHKSI